MRNSSLRRKMKIKGISKKMMMRISQMRDRNKRSLESSRRKIKLLRVINNILTITKGIQR